jgi:hypothetical protein
VSSRRPASALGQLVALTRVRWSMIRSRRSRALVASVIVGGLGLVALTFVIANSAPKAYAADILILMPTLIAGFFVLSVVAAVAAGGGNELIPAEQLVAYPLSPRTQFLAGLLLTPINIAWSTQALLLVAAVGNVTVSLRSAIPPLIGFLLFILCATVSAQALAWLIVGIRQRRTGRRVTWALVAALVVGLFLLVRSGQLIGILDRSPASALVAALLSGTQVRWWAAVGLLMAVTIVVSYLGAHACTWALTRRADPTSQDESHSLQRRHGPLRPLREQIAVDRASVWRSAPLRRGALVLGLLPGVATALAGLEWASIALLPGLVAAGAGLLFGVNALSLDGSGSVWRATLPSDPDGLLLAKAVVMSEVALITVGMAVAGAALRAQGRPSAAAVAAIAASVTVAVTGVVTRCLRWSVTRPHRAELRAARDTPTPPGTMAAYSARLALRMTLTGGLFVIAAQASSMSVPVVLAVPFLIFSAHSLVGTLRRWRDEHRRAGVVVTVAYG